MKFRSARQRKAVMAILRKYHISVRKLPATVKASNHQYGKSNLKADRRFRALKPGKRISGTGKAYYEYRRNHSDKHPAQRL